MSVPDGTRVPHWAYSASFVRAFPSELRLLVQEVSSTVSLQVGNSWDSTGAEAEGGSRHFDSVHTLVFLCRSDSPEVTGSVVMADASLFTYSATPLASSLSSTFSPTALRSASSSTFSHTASGSASSSTPTSRTSPKRGEMEGSVVGGIVGAALISGVVVWFVRRRRARSAPSTTDTRGEMEQPVTYQPLTIKTPKLYVSLYSLTLYHQVWGECCNLHARAYSQDPSDPATYPKIEFQPQRLGCTSQPNQVEYSGLPEL
jgi:hypothetical protein